MSKNNGDGEIFDPAEADAQRDLGMARAASKSSAWFMAALTRIRTLPPGYEGIAEDIRVDLDLGMPPSPGAVGSVTRHAGKLGLLVRTGDMRKPRAVKSHSRATYVWRRPWFSLDTGITQCGNAAGLTAAQGDCKMAGLFGFSTEPATGGDFLPIIKYDARAGRVIRVDRVDQGGGNYVRQETDITDRFLAMADLENVEVGWINFPQGGAPHAVLVPFNPTNLKLPAQPSDQHKNGIRFLVKLHASCADGAPEVREVMTTAKAALGGIEELVQMFLTERNEGRHLDELPIIKLASVTPIKTGSGSKTSTNYTPKFAAVGWGKRPSTFVFSPKDGPRPVPAGQTQAQGNGHQAPATGATRAAPPQQVVSQPQQPAITGGVDVNDFG